MAFPNRFGGPAAAPPAAAPVSAPAISVPPGASAGAPPLAPPRKKAPPFGKPRAFQKAPAASLRGGKR